MFGNHKNDDLGNSEDPQDNGGFISTPHPDPTGVPEPPAPGSFDPTAPTADAPAPTEPEVAAPAAPASDDTTTPDDTTPAADTPDTPQFGQPFTPGSVLPAADTSEPADTTPPTDNPPVSDELLEIKKEALQNLTPLVDHLDQTPEERFKTTMMMIQAADDQSLIQRAYEAANQITDESAKAQALLDIVNEINYFTQQHNQ